MHRNHREASSTQQATGMQALLDLAHHSSQTRQLAARPDAATTSVRVPRQGAQGRSYQREDLRQRPPRPALYSPDRNAGIASPLRGQQPGPRHRRLGQDTSRYASNAGRPRRGFTAEDQHHLGRRRRWRNAVTMAMSPGQRIQYAIFVVVWLLAGCYFWVWWFQPGHAGNPVLFSAVSIASFYIVTLLPSFYLFYLGRMRRPKPVDVHYAEKAGAVGRVAVISLTVPGSESLDIVWRQLVAMRSIRYPHDSWILVDKEHSPEIEQLARRLGVYYFCRHDSSVWGSEQVLNWNTPAPPFQTKTKAGNVNSWLDQYGGLYTHFTQLDIDHLPTPTYLHKVLGYFTDPKVAWVQAPSVYGNHQHWTARGSSEQEVVLQGPLQMGFFGFCRTPFIIGSHCTYDMAAIKQIGGFQPTRAEDHLDTVHLAAEGREGVYLPEIIAVGDGPETFDIYLAQQFAWAFSLIQVLFRFTPKLIRRYAPRQALQFLFAQTWYPFWSTSMLIVFLAPLFSLVLDSPVSHVTLWAFLRHSIPMALTSTAIWWWSRSWHQPRSVALSWRGIVLHMARWVVVLSAFAQVILRVKKPYMITVKGLASDAYKPFRMAVLAPYIVLIVSALAACWFYMIVYSHSSCQGYLIFALEEAALFGLLILVIVTHDARSLGRAGISTIRYYRLRVKPVLMTLVVWSLIAGTFFIAFGRILEALSKS